MEFLEKKQKYNPFLPKHLLKIRFVETFGYILYHKNIRNIAKFLLQFFEILNNHIFKKTLTIV